MANLNYFNFLKRAKFNPKWAHIYYKAYNKIAKSDLFDANFYVKAYPKVAKSGLDPLEHYLFYGFKEGRIPSLYFDGDYYLEKYPNVKESGINPLVHYLLYGVKEGKKIRLSPVLAKRNEITETNRLFINNYEFGSCLTKDENANPINGEPLVSIIILNLNGLKHLKRLFKDFDKKTNYSNYEIIVVDNGSKDKSVSYLETLANDLPIRIIKNEKNESFSKANNDAVAISKGEYVLLLNNDIEPTFGWLNEMMGTMLFDKNIRRFSADVNSNLHSDAEVAAVGAKLVFPYYYDLDSKDKSFTIQHAGDMFAERMYPCCAYAFNKSSSFNQIFDVSINKNEDCIAVTGAVTLIKKSVYEELGGLDEDFVYGLEDVDFSLKLNKAGYRTVFASHALLFHHESSTRSNDSDYVAKDAKNIKTLRRKQGKYLSKNMLLDKLNNNNFFTPKPLDFIFVEDNFNQNSENYEFISGMAKVFNKMDYAADLITDLEDYFCGNSVDILISFSKAYKIANIEARKDILKVAMIKEFNHNNINDIESIDNLKDYDLIISSNINIFKELRATLSDNGVNIKNKIFNISFDPNNYDYDSYCDNLLDIINNFVLNYWCYA